MQEFIAIEDRIQSSEFEMQALKNECAYLRQSQALWAEKHDELVRVIQEIELKTARLLAELRATERVQREDSNDEEDKASVRGEGIEERDSEAVTSSELADGHKARVSDWANGLIVDRTHLVIGSHYKDI